MGTDATSGTSPTPWGEFDFDSEVWRRWRLGPTTLWIQRLPNEWRVAWQESRDPGVELSLEVAREDPEGPPEAAQCERIASQRLSERLRLSPRLADRSVVARPETRFRLAPQGEVEIFIGTAVWLRLENVDPELVLLEVPARRLSDSWFGPSTTQGELCYSSQTAARLQRQNIPYAVHRAFTRVLLRNHAADDLVLERINLPVPNLALFEDPEGVLWTQSVRMERASDGKGAEVQIEAGPPDFSAASRRLAGPRVQVQRNIFSKALDALLG